MKPTLVTPALIALLVAGAAACGHAGDDTSALDGEPQRAPAAQQALAAKAAARPAGKVAAPAPRDEAADGECNCHDHPGDAAAEAKVEDVRVGAAPIRGAERAPVTVVVFTDFQCPFCARAEKTMAALTQKYAGRVRVAFKNNPLPFHENGRLAARAAMAAGEQGKFWEYHDALFAHQDALGREALEGYAKDLGIDLVRFRAALESSHIAAAVDADVAEAGALDVKGTPCFFVNGRRIVGAQPLAAFEAAVDEALAARR
jgi:protein-disulfide isomerase